MCAQQFRVFLSAPDRIEGVARRQRQEAERNEAQLAAWRRPGARPGPRQDAATDRAAAYAEYVQRIQKRMEGRMNYNGRPNTCSLSCSRSTSGRGPRVPGIDADDG
jgi:hypothetical protein